MTHIYTFFRSAKGWMESRLLHLDSAGLRREAWEQQAEGTRKKLSRDQDPYVQMRSHTEHLKQDLENIQKSWWTWLTLRQGRLTKKRIDSEVYRKLSTSSDKWDSWFQRITHWGERRELWSKTRLQVTKDLLGTLENEKSEILIRRERFSRAASFLRGRGAISRKELTRKQDLSTLLGKLQVKFERKVPANGGRLQTLYALRDVEDMLRDTLKGKVPENQIETLMNIDADGGAGLRRELKRISAGDWKYHRDLMRAVRKLSWRGRYKQLDALESDLINTSPPKERLHKLDTDKVCGHQLEFSLEGRPVKGIVMSRESPRLTLHDTSKAKEDPEGILILDIKDGFLLERKGQSFRDHSLLKDKTNTFRLPPRTIRAAA